MPDASYTKLPVWGGVWHLQVCSASIEEENHRNCSKRMTFKDTDDVFNTLKPEVWRAIFAMLPLCIERRNSTSRIRTGLRKKRFCQQRQKFPGCTWGVVSRPYSAKTEHCSGLESGRQQFWALDFSFWSTADPPRWTWRDWARFRRGTKSRRSGARQPRIGWKSPRITQAQPLNTHCTVILRQPLPKTQWITNHTITSSLCWNRTKSTKEVLDRKAKFFTVRLKAKIHMRFF